MRRILFLLTIPVAAILLISCENSFDPYGDFNDQYVLNCVIRVDTTFQIATISRTYKTSNGISSTGNIDDSSVKGARITLTCYGSFDTKVYQFRDTIVEKSNERNYMTPIHFYYLKNFKPPDCSIEINPGVYRIDSYMMKIDAILPDGKKLTAFAYAMGLDSAYINTYKQTNPVLLDNKYLSFMIERNYQPELVIKYSKLENGNWVDYEKLVPKYYYKNANGEIPVYPKIETFDKYVNYDTLAIRKTLGDLSANDPNKQNYIIRKVVFMLNVLYGGILSSLSSQQTFSSDFSYRVSQPDNSTTNGGLGVFGDMYTIKMEVPIPQMIRSLGYRNN